ncbi:MULTISPECIES: TerC family protein [unclassified Paludibacterium]|uniref:TerC family protein n=1 Tax=unclassified Paludibacterium TaxID=2618429 RepID=UPI001C047281|nr:TerC family protein [Paludibacterium sp. B53371]
MTSSVPSVGSPLFYLLFFVMVLGMIALDMLALKQKGPHRVTTREALGWSLVWFSVALAFGFGLWAWLAHDPAVGPVIARQKALEFFTGYVIEKALAVDNIFVFLVIFGFFGVPAEHQRKVLLYGVLGALVLRALMVGLGAALVAEFSWVLYLFGAFLLLTGIKMLKGNDSDPDLSQSRLLAWLRRHMRLSDRLEGEAFFTRRNGMLYATPLLLCLVMIELSDVVFAVDSIPAIFAVTLDPFIVLTSNILAILGLRALFFLLTGMLDRFHLLQIGLALVLCFIGLKMLLVNWLHIAAGWSLLVVFLLLGGSVVLSLLRPQPAQ